MFDMAPFTSFRVTSSAYRGRSLRSISSGGT
jgi:hypothetical protein